MVNFFEVSTVCRGYKNGENATPHDTCLQSSKNLEPYIHQTTWSRYSVGGGLLHDRSIDQDITHITINQKQNINLRLS